MSEKVLLELDVNGYLLMILFRYFKNVLGMYGGYFVMYLYAFSTHWRCCKDALMFRDALNN